MKTLIYIFTALFVVSCNSQSKSNAIRNDALILNTTGGMNGGCKYLEEPIYLINDNYVIYQDCNTRKKLYADELTFKIPKYLNEYGFAIDKNGVYIKGDFVATDTTGFTFLGIKEKDLFWKTKVSVYKNKVALPNLNASEFTQFANSKTGYKSRIYFKDKQDIYFFNEKIEGIDLTTAELDEDNQLLYDKKNTYKDGKTVTFEGETVFYVNNSVKKTATKVLYEGKIVKNIDPKTLIGLSRHYAKDKNGIYFTGYNDGFQILPINKNDFNNIKIWDHTNSAYITDGKNLFYHNNLFPKNKFDVASFRTFGFTDYCYDKNGVYTRRYDNNLKNVVYYKFPFKYKDDVSSKNLNITVGSNLYVYYDNQAYEESTNTLYENLTLEQIEISKKNAHTPTMRRLTKLNGITTLTTTFDYKLFKTDNNIYYDNNKTIGEAITFKELQNPYFVDSKNVYKYSRENGLKVINNIDVNTAKKFNGFIKDKNYLYYNETQIIKSGNLEILAVFPGYRLGCGEDTTPGSNFYLFKNTEGYWWVKISNEITYRYLGKKLDTALSPLFENLDK